MSQASSVEADIDIQGNVSGQIIAGNYNVQIQNSNGVVVNVSSSTGQPMYSRRPTPIDLRPRGFPSLLDRENESKTAKTALQKFTPISIYGEEGIGKTVLVRQLAQVPEGESFPDGVVYLEAPGKGVEDLLQSIFESFCKSQPEFKPTETQIRIALRELKALIFLDHSTLGRDEILSILNVARNSLFVFSSVERNLWGEGQPIFLRGLPEQEAFMLFQRELNRPINEAEQSAVKQICTLLQGHPFQIIRAASLVNERLKPIAELVEELQDAVPEKAILKASLQTLTNDQESVLSLLAAVGGMVMPLEHLVSLSQDPNVQKLLQRLIALGLVQAHSPRYSLTGNVASSLAALWDLSSWEDRLADYFVRWLEGQPSQSLIEESIDAVFYLVKRLGERERWEEAIRLGRALERGLILGKRWQAWADVLNLILKAARALSDRKVEAWALHQLGSRAMCLGYTDQARELLTEALNIRKSIKDRAGLKVTRHNLNVLQGGSVPPKGDKSGGTHWFLRGIGILMTLTIAGIFVYAGLSLAGVNLKFPFPQFSFWPSATPTVTNTYTATASATPTSSATLTASATPTATDTLTLTPSRTPTPTNTFTPSPTKTPTDTATPTSTPLPIVLYDFVGMAKSAKWQNDRRENLLFPGSYSDSRGFALWWEDFPLEDGSTPDLVLETHPRWESNGQITGTYVNLGNFVVENGDRFVGRVGFLSGGGDGNVTFKVIIVYSGNGANCTGSGTCQVEDSKSKAYDGKLLPWTYDIPQALIGKPILTVKLQVDAGPSSGQDWAVWAEAYLERP